MKLWYALHCRPNTERQVVDKLHLANVGGFYAHVIRKSLDGRRTVEEKLFPGYAFVHFDLKDRRVIFGIPQVVSILGAGPGIEAIPDAEIAAVQQMLVAPQTLKVHAHFAGGERVRVERGPLQGLEGLVIYEHGSARVVVSVTMLHRSISAEVDRDDLQLLEPMRMAA